MRELSVIIPARNEMFLIRTIDSVLENMRGDTEVIVILDGYWPDPPIVDHPRVTILHFTDSIGQRAATNVGARVSQAEFVMKLDAHCSVSEGFDVRLIAPYKSGELDRTVTTIPRMYNLYGFDYVCPDGHRRYQSPPGPCLTCGKPVVMDVIWKPRLARRTDFARFDKNMQFQYWKNYKNRPEAEGNYVDVMCSVGAAMFMKRDRFFELGCMDETHGSWGQFGVEIACKSWLSGGRQIVNKKAWFAHMFRTQNDGFSFPYPIREKDIQAAKRYSRDLWLNDKWPGAVRPLSWLIDKFKPIPDWHEDAT